MTSVVLDRPKTHSSLSCFSKRVSVPQTQVPSLAYVHTGDVPPQPSPKPATSAFAIVAALTALLLIWRERERVRRQLAVMSERELQDVGTCQSEIACEIAKPFWRALVVSAAAR